MKRGIKMKRSLSQQGRQIFARATNRALRREMVRQAKATKARA